MALLKKKKNVDESYEHKKQKKLLHRGKKKSSID